MDVWVNFTHATKWQAEGIFKCFFPSKPAAADKEKEKEGVDKDGVDKDDEKKDASQKNLPGSKRKAHAHAIPLLSEAEISELAKRFAEAIPENELSVSIVTVVLDYAD
jgi:mitochondrial chaperone BCS1